MDASECKGVAIMSFSNRCFFTKALFLKEVDELLHGRIAKKVCVEGVDVDPSRSHLRLQAALRWEILNHCHPRDVGESVGAFVLASLPRGWRV